MCCLWGVAFFVGEVNKRSSFSARRRFSVLLCWRGHRSLSLAWELPRLPLHLQAGFRACHQRKRNHQRRKKMLQSVTGSVVFRGIGHQTKQGKSEVSNQRKTRQGLCSQGLKIIVKKVIFRQKKGFFYLTINAENVIL